MSIDAQIKDESKMIVSGNDPFLGQLILHALNQSPDVKIQDNKTLEISVPYQGSKTSLTISLSNFDTLNSQRNQRVWLPFALTSGYDIGSELKTQLGLLAKLSSSGFKTILDLDDKPAKPKNRNEFDFFSYSYYATSPIDFKKFLNSIKYVFNFDKFEIDVRYSFALGHFFIGYHPLDEIFNYALSKGSQSRMSENAIRLLCVQRFKVMSELLHMSKKQTSNFDKNAEFFDSFFYSDLIKDLTQLSISISQALQKDTATICHLNDIVFTEAQTKKRTSEKDLFHNLENLSEITQYLNASEKFTLEARRLCKATIEFWNKVQTEFECFKFGKEWVDIFNKTIQLNPILALLSSGIICTYALPNQAFGFCLAPEAFSSIIVHEFTGSHTMQRANLSHSLDEEDATNMI